MENLISKEYVEKLKQLHQSNPSFGSKNNIPALLKKCLESHETKTVLDYGCGKGNVMNEIKNIFSNLQIQGYDPAVDEYNVLPDKTFNLVFSTDVLEHVEPEFLDETLKFLSTKSLLIYHLIALEPSSVILPDGRNAHLILESPEWWRNKFLSLGYTILNEHHMKHVNKKKNKLVNKYFIMAIKN
jgi:2-polyprenyl-3-methyl-5-hydroxy-6-metoxy-1,4-benzoquinol methylase